MVSTPEIQERIAKCQKILDSDPNSQIFAALAEAHRRAGELEKAFRVCQNGLKVHPSYGSAHVVMAKINLDRGLYDWAEIEARKAAELDSWTRATELLLAEIHIYKGEFKPAVKLLKRLHEADPNNSQITKLLEIARQIPREAAVEPAPAAAAPPPVQEPSPAPVVEPAPARAGEASSEAFSIKDTLSRAVETEELDGALFINHEGLVLESRWDSDSDAAACGAVLGEVGNKLNREMQGTLLGELDTVLIETEGPVFYLVRAEKGSFLFAAGASANIGRLRTRLESLLHGHI